MDKKILNSDFKLGILGGGQLGKMLALAAGNWHLPVSILDASRQYPAAPFVHQFVQGSFKDYDAVYNFGKQVDLLTIEIEHVNIEALLKLAEEGLPVHPAPSALQIIKDKGLQKQFYQEKGFPTSTFQLIPDKVTLLEKLANGSVAYPFVQKTRTAGYDGQGVAVIRKESDQHKILEGASVIEALVPIDKELAVVVARSPSGKISAFPTVEMVFHPTANLVEYLRCPANISAEVAQKANELACTVAESMGITGLLAVELFLDTNGQLLINEVAPRPHNSGHHTIESCETSQFEQHIRAILDLPLGSTQLRSPAVMVNLLGAEGYTGKAIYHGLAECLAIPGVHLHLYGKEQTRPFRKMGHATILADNIESAIEKGEEVRRRLEIRA